MSSIFAQQKEAVALKNKDAPVENPADYDYDQYPDTDEGPSESSAKAYNGICLGLVLSKNPKTKLIKILHKNIFKRIVNLVLFELSVHRIFHDVCGSWRKGSVRLIDANYFVFPGSMRWHG